MEALEYLVLPVAEEKVVFLERKEKQEILVMMDHL